MGVCTAVRDMSSAIDAAFGADDPQVRSTARALATMPYWLERGRLDLWEQHVQECRVDEVLESPPLTLLDEVFEFGRYNLYAAFNPEETAREFTRLRLLLSRSGIAIDQQDVATW